MKVSMNWKSNMPNAVPEEAATVADFEWFIGERCATRHVVDGSLRLQDSVTVALYGLVEGLVYDCWTVFGNRDRDISLQRYRCGFLLPDVRVRFDGVDFSLFAKPFVYGEREEFLEFFSVSPLVGSRADGEKWLESLITPVLQRLDDVGLGNNDAAQRWQRVQASRNNPGEQAFCEAAGSLGFDPYQVPEDIASFIEALEQVFDEKDALVEFVAGVQNADKGKLLEWLNGASKQEEVLSYLPAIPELAESISIKSQAVHDKRAWAVGYRAARMARCWLGLAANDKFGSYQDVARKFGASRRFAAVPAVDGLDALRQVRRDAVHVYLRDHGGSAVAGSAQLFTMARAVGDAVCFPQVKCSCINHLQGAYRQAVSRAFAAEFLAPVDAVEGMQDSGHDISYVADQFNVSAHLIDWQLINKDRIRQACSEMN